MTPTLRWEDQSFIIVKPQTFVNRSGEAVQELFSFFQIPASDLIVFVDDLHLPLGKIRIREQGSDGGHNGLKSIIEQLGQNRFARIRIGLGSPPPRFSQERFVLGVFLQEEMPIIEQSVIQAGTAVLKWLTSGVDKIMQEFNSTAEGGQS